MMNGVMDIRDAVVASLVEAAEGGVDIMVLVSDSTTTSKIKPFAERFPDRLVNVGIAEQNLVGIAAGLSLDGRVAITANAAPFLVGRANEQVKVDVCYARTNVKMLGINAGVAYGPLAATHHSIDDISIMRGFGNVLVFSPTDAIEATAIMRWALRYEGPVYIRVDSAALPFQHREDYTFIPGKLDKIIEGADLAIFATGPLTHEAAAAAKLLAGAGIAASVYNCPSLRPFDGKAAAAAVAACGGRALTVEEHSVHGGLGSLLAEALAENATDATVSANCGAGCRLKRLGIPEGEFSVAGPRAAIRAHYGLDAAGIARHAAELLGR